MGCVLASVIPRACAWDSDQCRLNGLAPDARAVYVARERERVTVAELFEQVAERILREGESAKVAFLGKLHQLATAEGTPQYDVMPHRPQANAISTGERPTLKMMLEQWIEGKTLEEVGEQHRRETAIRQRERGGRVSTE